jgi:hypothetical protein
MTDRSSWWRQPGGARRSQAQQLVEGADRPEQAEQSGYPRPGTGGGVLGSWTGQAT